METEVQSSSADTSSAAPSSASDVSTPSATTETASTSSSNPVAASSESTGSTSQTVTDGTATPPAWAPNFKYKALDKEHEIEEEYRSYIKSADDEKKIKRLFEQKAGVEHLKTERNTFREELQTTKQKVESYDGSFAKFNELTSKGEFKKAFEVFNVPKEVLLKAAKQVIEFDELPQQQQQMHNQMQEQERHNAMLSEERNQVLSQMNQFKTQLLQSELQTVLGRPDVKAVSQKYDEANGPGSFFELVKSRGQQAAKFSGTDPTASQVVDELLKQYKPFLSQSAPQPQAPVQKDLPVIPATGSGNSQSPGERKPQSFAEMRKIAANFR